MLTEFKLTVEYTHILVFRPEFENFDGLWDEEDVAQGFVWSEGFVSFGIPDHDGSIIIQIFLEENYDDIVTYSEISITVPFYVNSDEVLIGTILY